MATVAEKTADIATLLDDIAATLDTAEWNTVDSGVDNSGSTADWQDNAVLRQHPNTGVHLLFYIHDTGNLPSGIRVLVSQDWNATDTRPAGYSNYNGDDVDSTDVDGLGTSFSNFSTNDDHAKYGIYTLAGNNTSVSRTDDVSYFISATSTHVAVSAVDEHDTTWGGNGWLLFEHVDNKFWSDGWGDWAGFSKQGRYSNNQEATSMYGWNLYRSSSDGPEGIEPSGGFEDGAWGHFNPQAGDDTFLFQRPIIYSTTQRDVPSAYVEDLVFNSHRDGLNHGEEITVDGTTYKCHRAKGEGSENESYNWTTILMRYE